MSHFTSFKWISIFLDTGEGFLNLVNSGILPLGAYMQLLLESMGSACALVVAELSLYCKYIA